VPRETIEPRWIPGLVNYLAVFALFCFGFFGVFAFLSMSLLTAGARRPLDVVDPSPVRLLLPWQE